MKKAIFTCAGAICLLANGFQIQTDGTVSGRIIDKVSHSPIGSVTISDELTRRTVTQLDGAFTMQLPSGKHHLMIYAGGYKTVHFDVDIPSRRGMLISDDGFVRLEPVIPPVLPQ